MDSLPDDRQRRRAEGASARYWMRLGLGAFVIAGAFVNFSLDLILGMAGDSCESETGSMICSAGVQMAAGWLPWVFYAAAVSAAAVGIRREHGWFTGSTSLGAAVTAYVIGVLLLVAVVT